MKIDFSRPGKPTDNAFVESFNGTFRAECLNAHWFGTLAEAKRLIEVWRQEYNESRPHRSLGERTAQRSDLPICAPTNIGEWSSEPNELPTAF
jgi:putative transposase